MPAYADLAEHYRRLSHLDHVASIVSWDEETMMPTGGGEARAQAMATLAQIRHEHACAGEVGELLEQAGSEDLDPWQRRNVDCIRKMWTRNCALPSDLVGARTRAQSRCQQRWRELRAANNWRDFLPLFEDVLRIERQVAAILGESLSCDPYDALIEGWDPGLSQSIIDPIFADLRAYLPSFIERAVDAAQTRTRSLPRGPFPQAAQRELGLKVMHALGFDFDRGRLDVSAHPFCGGVPQDVRITTRYNEDDFTSALMGVIHETGHGLYEQGLPSQWTEQPVGGALGMATHESQSLAFEMQLARSQPFLQFLAPLVREAFADQAKAQPAAFTAENLSALYGHVERSLIRVNADEATYPAHILLRYDLEKQLIGGELEARDVPEHWDRGMRELLGLSTLGNDKDGCMQDVHWPAGVFGYFPSYTLGAMAAAQFFAALRSALPDVDPSVARGDFVGMRQWLNDNVWSQASRYPLDELLERATGEKLNPRHFRQHLEQRYLQG